jgi:hypothetical protein
MAGLGYRTWTPGEIITADNVQDYLQDQTVQVFTNSAARGSALTGSLAEGMMSYLKSTQKVEVFDGSLWQEIGPGVKIFVTSGTPTASAAGDLWFY